MPTRIILLLLLASLRCYGAELGLGPAPVTSAAPSGAAGGDLGGTYPSPTVLSVANVTAGTLPAARGGTGVSNAGTITNASNTTITGGGTLALGGFTLTAPATGTAALLGTGNTFSLLNNFSNGLYLGGGASAQGRCIYSAANGSTICGQTASSYDFSVLSAGLATAVGMTTGTKDFVFLSATSSAITLGTAGGGLSIKSGTNARCGTSTLVGGTIAVANTSVTANTKVFTQHATLGGTVGTITYTKVNSTSFTLTSTSGTDTSTVDWFLVENP